MKFMIVESYREGAASAIYQRFRDHGRMLPEGLSYLDSWVSTDLKRCYQLMSCERSELIDEWIRHWQDLVEFEVVSVFSSAEAAEKLQADGGD